MRGEAQIIDTLNQLLTGELSAMDQYFIHGLMYEDWGLTELHERISHESEDEREHARKLVERILFLEGKPDVASREALHIGTNPQEMLQNDLNYEYQVADNLRKAIALCEIQKDYASRELLEVLLEETESDHMYWLEKQLGLIDKVGLENYLQSKM